MIVICVVLLDLIRSRVMCVCVHLLMGRLCFNRHGRHITVPFFLPRIRSHRTKENRRSRRVASTHGLVAPTVVYSIEEKVVGTRFPADEDRCTRF